MIPIDFITEWRDRAPWTQDAQVEQDLIVTRALVEMFNQKLLAQSLAFRGGTALYKLYLLPPARYSEDIDLVQVQAEPIGPTIDAIRTVLDPWLGVPRRSIKEGRVSITYRMTSEGATAVPMRLKVEIDSREHFSVLGMEHREISIDTRWFKGTASVPTYALDELLGTKFRALYQRKKGRDLFDLWTASRRADINPTRIIDCFLRYMEHGENQISRAMMEMNLHSKFSDPDFLTDIDPLIGPGVDWDSVSAANYVWDELVSRLPGEPWKGLPTG